jgi:hypothetical protein
MPLVVLAQLLVPMEISRWLDFQPPKQIAPGTFPLELQI